ncbi:MAG: threonine-phosphate decarboxylase, partial [Gammaproteobacteria bacterium]|nr:threonine-phosphate decarboxylase [Gammaproteobacteria bacterium]
MSTDATQLLHHGGRLRAAAAQFRIPLTDWIDLSTGINPNGWPVPAIPTECWQRLPEDEDALERVACTYYGSAHTLATAGSQAALQILPQLRARCRVGIIHPSYQEHLHAWRSAGHDVRAINADHIARELADLDVS